MKTRDALHCVLHLAVLLGWLSAAGAAENLPCTNLPNLQRMECEHQARQAERPAPVPPPPPSLRMEGPSGEVYNPLIAFCGTPAGGVERWERCVHAYMEEHQRAAEAALFTEANVVMPATLLSGGSPARHVFRFWGLAVLGNVAGALLVGLMVSSVGSYDASFDALLAATIDAKMRFRAIGGVEGWMQALLSGVLANWLVGMAAFFATMGRTIIGKHIPVLLAVTTFVAAGFQHAPANLGYFALSIFGGEGPSLWSAVSWNLIPAGIGNVLGGAVLVALPFWYLYGRNR